MQRVRSITSRESLRFLKERLSGLDYLGVNFSNHKKTHRTKDTYQVTIDKISDEAIARLIESDLVSDVYYCASMPPGGQGYGIDLRYKLYIRYNKVAVKSRTRKSTRKSKNDEK